MNISLDPEDAFPEVIRVESADGKTVQLYTAQIPPLRESMLRYMEMWSESTYAAGWLINLEHAMLGEPLFRALVNECGGWWTFDDKTPVNLAEELPPGEHHWRKWVDGTLAELEASRDA